jgi:hypothetical protein
MFKKIINTVYCAFIVVIVFIILVFKYSLKVNKVKRVDLREEIRSEVLRGIQQEIERQQQNRRSSTCLFYCMSIILNYREIFSYIIFT